jgi:hypothetical protein
VTGDQAREIASEWVSVLEDRLPEHAQKAVWNTMWRMLATMPNVQDHWAVLPDGIVVLATDDAVYLVQGALDGTKLATADRWPLARGVVVIRVALGGRKVGDRGAVRSREWTFTWSKERTLTIQGTEGVDSGELDQAESVARRIAGALGWPVSGHGD